MNPSTLVNLKRVMKPWLPALALMGMLFLSLLGWFEMKTGHTEQQRETFNRLVDKLETDIKNGLLFYEDALWGGTGLFAASKRVTLVDWIAYVDALNIHERYPGINGLGTVAEVGRDQLGAYEEQMKKEVTPEFQIRFVPDGFENPGNLGNHYLIQYITPLSLNAPAVGLDIGSEPHRREAVEAARDTGKVQLTKIIRLVQDNEKVAGFLMLAPVYAKGMSTATVESRREAIRGWVYAPFIGKNFLQPYISNYKDVEINVYDDPHETPEHYIYGNMKEPGRKSELKQTRSIHAAGRTWTLWARPTLSFWHRTKHPYDEIILAGGVLLSFLVYWILILMSHSYQTASRMAEKMTRELRESEERYQLAVKGSTDGLYDWDVGSDAVFYSPRFKELLGYQDYEMENDFKAWESILHPEDRKATLDAIEAHLKDKILFDVEYRLRHKTGQYRWFRDRGEAVFDETGKALRMSGAITDIEDRKKTEIALENERINLEKVNAELDQFVYTASHDLRAPLRGISSFAAFLEQDYRERLDEEGKGYLLEIRRGIDQMNDLINDLLDLSRVSRIKNPYEPVEIKPLLDEILATCRFEIDQAHADIKIKEPMPTLIGDRIKLKIIFTNLIQNALKFSKKESANSSQIQIGYIDGEHHEFYVNDNGIGIEGKHHRDIFNLFKRLHAGGKYEGTGAGLTIAKKAVEDHGGRIWVNSEIKRGAQLHFTVPKNLIFSQKTKAA